MKKRVNNLVMYRYLLFTFMLKELKIRYKQSVIGFGWALLMPTTIVLAGVLIQKAFSMSSGRPFNFSDVASVSVKAIPWAFFISSIRFATMSLASNANLITKIYFPREVLPISSVLAHLVDFALSSLVLVLLLSAAEIGVSVYLLWVPLLLLILFVLTASIGMLLSCANLFFRDVKYIVDVALTFGIFFTPVFYEANMLGEWAPLVLLNPVGSVLEGLNSVIVLHRPPDLLWIGYALGVALFGLPIAWKIFERAEYAFAENI